MNIPILYSNRSSTHFVRTAVRKYSGIILRQILNFTNKPENREFVSRYVQSIRIKI